MIVVFCVLLVLLCVARWKYKIIRRKVYSFKMMQPIGAEYPSFGRWTEENWLWLINKIRQKYGSERVLEFIILLDEIEKQEKKHEMFEAKKMPKK